MNNFKCEACRKICDIKDPNIVILIDKITKTKLILVCCSCKRHITNTDLKYFMYITKEKAISFLKAKILK